MYHSRTKRVTSYGRRAQRVVAVSDDQRFGLDVFTISCGSEEDEPIQHHNKEYSGDIFERPRKQAPKPRGKVAQRSGGTSTLEKHNGKKASAKDVPIRKPLGSRPLNVPKSPAISPRSHKARAGNGKAILLGAQMGSTIPSCVDIDIIVLDDSGNQLDKERRVTKNVQANAVDSKPVRRTRRPTAVKSYAIYVSDEDDDDDDEYIPVSGTGLRKVKQSPEYSEEKIVLPTGRNTVRNAVAAPKEESPDKSEPDLPRKPKSSRRAVQTIILTDSDPDSGADEESEIKETWRTESEHISSIHTSQKRDAKTAKMQTSASSLLATSHAVDETHASEPSLPSQCAAENSRVDRSDKHAKKLPSAATKEIKKTRHHITSEPDVDDSQPWPRQIIPKYPSGPDSMYPQQRDARLSASPQLVTISDDDLSLSMDEELELALHIADLQLAKATRLSKTLLDKSSAATANTPTTVLNARFPPTDISRRPRIPSFLRPLLSECGQLATFDFASFIETFPADPIIGFSGHSILPDKSRGRVSFDSYQKVGEASYSEVFGIGNVVLKIIPLFDEENDVFDTWTAEWDSPPVSEVQDVLKEVVVTRAMGEICRGFIKLLKAHVVQGSYPQSLLGLWDKFHSTKGSESVRPDHFTPKQTYAIIVLPNGGLDLENFSFNSVDLMGGSGWRQACSIFWQVVRSLGNAEEFVHFEHRDLHWGQILVRGTMKSSHIMVPGSFGKVMLDDPWHGVQSTIIDLGLSRMDHGHGDSFWTPLDEEIFEGKGDYQYDIYRMMRKHIREDWSSFSPFTNVMWIHYLSDKLIHHKHLCVSSRTIPKHNRSNVQGGAQLAIMEADRRAYECLIEMERVLALSVATIARSAGAKRYKASKNAGVAYADEKDVKEMKSAGKNEPSQSYIARQSMALPNQLRTQVLPTELEFLASEELVEIFPVVKMDKIQFITGLYGPFIGGRITRVPLWVAVNLKLKKKCNIIPPDWLNVEVLQNKLTAETDERYKEEFSSFPFRYAEIAKVLLDVASDDLDQPDKIRTILKDLREARQSKIRDTLLRLNPASLKTTGVSAMEMNEVRSFLCKAMSTLINLKMESVGMIGDGDDTGMDQVGRDATSSEPNSTLFEFAELNGGLVAFGSIPSNFTESTGDTLGGIGSAIALKMHTFRKRSDGTFSGTFVVQPDRGFNIDGTINYQGRQHEIDFTLRPYYGTADLSFTDAQATLALQYKRTLLYWDVFNLPTTGLDGLGVRQPFLGFPELPIASESFNHLSADCEGLVLNADGTFWMSDEYGPYIYKFAPSGHLLQAIQPPKAILPFVNGRLNFTSDTDPDSGRAGNQGFEGLTVSPDGRTLYALLQSATMQDGGTSKKTNRFTRLLAYDVLNTFNRSPPLVGEWVVPLPQSDKGSTFAQSEVHYVSLNVFLVLSRDGDGHGGDDNNSAYKHADLFDISNATDIHGSAFDDPANPIAIDGILNSTITPATYVSFVDFLNPTQLARFGLHNGKPADSTLIDAKWESLALAPCNDPEFPNDFFLFTVADNDFLSTQGRFNGQSFDGGLDVDNQFMVFRVTLPTVQKGSIEQSIGI
ncbi:hypothetical protein A7U60_g5393 [Sanghuangporus baumii]|uniref:DNA replication complex GINS protein PSF2 n=1 Tax=Sanghuangporus baumii TaxID=108892 RepID=A0A9Q5HWU7_SANBA|nr:hypothetical protein A7U60_g5393 [Sanghuangporus baumii]